MEKRIEPKVGVVIVAGGSGTRIGGAIPKQYQILGSLPILAQTINAFAAALPTARVVVVVAEDRVEYWRNLAARFPVAEHSTAVGGAERFDSVRAGIEVVGEDVDLIAVHDGARPLVSAELISRCVECALSSGSAIPVVEVSDSLREVGNEGSEGGESRQLDRSRVRAVQTPQIFDALLLRRAYAAARGESGFTDDASVVERMGERVWLCSGERSNIKITTGEDLLFARAKMEAASDGE